MEEGIRYLCLSYKTSKAVFTFKSSACMYGLEVEWRDEKTMTRVSIMDPLLLQPNLLKGHHRLLISTVLINSSCQEPCTKQSVIWYRDCGHFSCLKNNQKSVVGT